VVKKGNDKIATKKKVVTPKNKRKPFENKGIKKRRPYPFILNLFLFLTILSLNLGLQSDPSYWGWCPDVRDYLFQSKQSLLSQDFYIPQQINSRPFTVPLFFKIAGSQPERIVRMQQIIHSLSVLFLVYALLLFLRKDVSKYLLMFFIYFLMSWWNILGWTLQLLSESLIISLLFCWIASFLLFYKKRKTYWLSLHVIITVLLSNTRDSWPYLLVAFYLMIVVFFFIWDRFLFKRSLLLLAVSISLLFFQQYAAGIGSRYRLPVANSIIIRVLPDEKYTGWFEKQGMPDVAYLKTTFPHIDAESKEDVSKIYNFYADESHASFLNWTTNKGKIIYTKFLLTHPAYTLLLNENLSKLNRILSYKYPLYHYYPLDPQGYSVLATKTFPLFHVLWIPFLCLSLIIIFIIKRQLITLFPVLISIMFLFNALLMYNADALEVERHMMLNNIVVQFICFWAIGLILDFVITRLRK
jgi:hypothetical protein